MRKLLFSRTQKKLYSDTVVRIGKNNLGFSLVELIIVIAIMAILAAVAIPVLGVFIEKAKKNNDQELISNILYAIEIGYKSGAYVNDDSFVMGDIAYPIGFIVLNKDEGVKVIASTTEIIDKVEGECEFKTDTITYLSKRTRTFYCSSSSNCTHRDDAYTVETLEVTYCATHSGVYRASGNLGPFAGDWECEGEGSGCSDHSSNWVMKDPINIADQTLVVDDKKEVYGQYKDTNMCQLAYACQTTGFYNNHQVSQVTSGTLYDAITATFGTDLSSLKLSYDGWLSEGVDHATLYTGIDNVVSEIEGYAELLLGVKLLAPDIVGEHLSGDYNDAEDMLEAIAEYIPTKYDPEDNGEQQWVDTWLAAPNGGLGYDFGLSEPDQAHKDFVYGMAVAYNRAFSTYCSASGIPSTYTDIISDFKTPLGTDLPGVGSIEIIPRPVNHAAFNGATVSSGKTLEQMFIDAGDTNGEYFDRCKNLYEQYIVSEACVENGRTVYKMFITVNETKNIAHAYNEVNGTGDLFSYYDSYLQELSALYTAAEAAAGDGIIIIVTVKEGVVDYLISPAAADPRNR